MTQTHEKLTTSPDLLKEVGREFYAVCDQVDSVFEDRGVDLDRIHPEHYWFTVADATSRLIQEKYSTTENLSPKGTALELAAATPYFLLTKQRMNALAAGRIEMQGDEVKRRVYYMSYYNGLIRDYAASHPEVTTHELNSSLTDIAKKTEVVSHPEALRGLLAESINGAQHELITGQVISEFGDVRPATTEEDLQGIDLVVKLPGKRHPLPIDVKASSTNVHHSSRGRSDRFFVTDKGTLMMWSQLTDEQLGGRFYLNPDEARKHAAKLKKEIVKHANTGRFRSVEY